MSNTSTVTPYVATPESTGPGIAELGAAAAAVCVIGAVAVAKWLAEETEEDQAALARSRADRQSERLGSARPSIASSHPRSLTTVELHLREPESLIRAAERLGYRREPLTHIAESPTHRPEALLRSASGERLAIMRDADGRVVVGTAGDARRIQKIVRQHTVDRVDEHLKAKAMSVQTARLPNGEVQFFAREREAGQRGGSAEIRIEVRNDGSTWVDIDKTRGSRCEEIVVGIANALGGEVCHTSKKDSYFQLPGEPTKSKVKV